MTKLYPGDVFDTIRRRRIAEVSDPKLLEKCRDVADLARDVAYNGSFVANLEEPEEVGAYEHIGTWFVPLDFNRFISVREAPRENPEDEVRVELKIMVGAKEPCEPEVIATFYEDDSVELSGNSGVTHEDIDGLRELLLHIHNSPGK